MLAIFHDPQVHSPRFSQHPVIAVSDDGFAVPVPKALAAFDGAGELQNALAGVKGRGVESHRSHYLHTELIFLFCVWTGKLGNQSGAFLQFLLPGENGISESVRTGI